MPEVKNGNNYVGWKPFMWAIGILLMLVMAVASMSGNTMNKVSEVKSVQSSISADMDWVKQSLIRIENKL